MLTLAVLDAQLGQDVGGVEAGVVAELAGDDLEGFGERFDDGLLLAGHGEVGVLVEVGGYFHLRVSSLAPGLQGRCAKTAG